MYQFAAMQLTTIAAHADGPTEADWIRWAGVVLAFTGTLIAAPKGVVRILQSAGEAAAAAVLWVFKVTGIGARLTKTFDELFSTLESIWKIGEPIFRWIQDRAKKQADTRNLPEDEPSTNIQINWDQSEPLEAKVEYLHSIIGQVVEQISIVHRAAESRDARLDRASRDLRETTATLERRINEADLGAAKADARGVILIGVGTILTGIPDELARVAWIGWLAFAIALLLFSGVTLAIAQERRAVARAHRIAQG